MRFGLLLIGDELLDGKTTDANTKHLGTFLHGLGLSLSHVLASADDDGEIAKSLEVLYQQFGCDIVITSGGLGPTPDDKTKLAFAKYFKQEIIQRADVAALVGEHYRAFGREWAPGQNNYDHFPKDFTPVKNPIGLAPGLFYLHEAGKKALACAPGVPREFAAMLKESIYPLLSNHFKLIHRDTERLCVRTLGVPEETIFFKLAPNLWQELSEFGEPASYPHAMGVDIVVRPFENTTKGWQEKALEKILASPIAPNIWQVGEEEIAPYLIHLMRKKSLTLSFAESCTGGLAASLITDISGSSDIFLGSYVTYSNELKMSALGVSKDTLQSHGAVSIEVAREMAQGARERSHSNIAVAFSGIAGPGGGSAEKPVGTVAIAVSSKYGEHSELYHFRGDREILKLRFALKGLHLAREVTLKY